MARKFSKEPEAWALLGKHYFTKKNFKEARFTLQRALQTLDKKTHVEIHEEPKTMEEVEDRLIKEKGSKEDAVIPNLVNDQGENCGQIAETWAAAKLAEKKAKQTCRHICRTC